MKTRSARGRFVIVAAVDFSDESREALRVAHTMTKANVKAELHVVHVVPPPVGLVGLTAAAPESAVQFADLTETARGDLEELCAREASELGDRIFGHVRAGDPAREIVALAKELAADLIVTGTHGRTGLGRVLLGSTAETVVRRAPCSVLTSRKAAAVPRIEPACAGCTRAKRTAGDLKAMCERHTRSHPTLRPHAFFRFGT